MSPDARFPAEAKQPFIMGYASLERTHHCSLLAMTPCTVGIHISPDRQQFFSQYQKIILIFFIISANILILYRYPGLFAYCSSCCCSQKSSSKKTAPAHIHLNHLYSASSIILRVIRQTQLYSYLLIRLFHQQSLQNLVNLALSPDTSSIVLMVSMPA